MFRRSNAGGILCSGRGRLLLVSLCGDALVQAARSHIGLSPPWGLPQSLSTLWWLPIQQAKRHDEENGSWCNNHGAGVEDVEVLARLVNQSSYNSKSHYEYVLFLCCISFSTADEIEMAPNQPSQMQKMGLRVGNVSRESKGRLIRFGSGGFEFIL